MSTLFAFLHHSALMLASAVANRAIGLLSIALTREFLSWRGR